MKGGCEAGGGGFAAFTPLAARARGWLMAAVRAVGVTHGRRTPGAAPWLSRAFHSFPPPLSTRHRDAAGGGPRSGHPLTLLLLSSSACPGISPWYPPCTLSAFWAHLRPPLRVPRHAVAANGSHTDAGVPRRVGARSLHLYLVLCCWQRVGLCCIWSLPCVAAVCKRTMRAGPLTAAPLPGRDV